MPRIALERADTEPLEFDERMTLPAESLGEDVVSPVTVRLSGSVTRSERGYVLSGLVRGEGSLRCVRCLEAFPFAMGEALELELLPATTVPQEDETRLGPEDLDVVFFEEKAVELEAIAAEQFQLAVPMKPLCRDDCKGLCGRCGANLNRGACTCAPEADERWQPLAGWRPPN